MKAFIQFVISILMIILITFMGGVVAVQMYKWFIMPVFGITTQITYWQGAGISMFVRCFFIPFMVKECTENKSKSFSDSMSDMGMLILLYLVALGTGWILHYFL